MTVVQNPKTSEMDTMPLGAMAETAVDFVLDPDEIAGFLNEVAE